VLLGGAVQRRERDRMATGEVPMTKLKAALAVAVLTCIWAGANAVGASASPTAVAWSKCYAQMGPFQCGTVQVPLDYDSPNGTTISIALVRLPAADPAHRIGSLFLNPGGPGGSGVDYTVFAGPFLYTPEVRARFDLVGFDPRGTNRSTALHCFGTDRQWQPYFTPFAFPSTPAEEQTWMNADLFVDASCAQRGQRVADHMSTANVARDLDLLRTAVGDAKLSYAGVSYGTMLGQTYANMFPNNVRAMIIDGVLDPIAWTTGSGDGATVPFSTRLRSDVGAQATLNEFFRLCDVGAARCAFAPNSATRYAALGAQLKAHPAEVTFPDGSTGEINYSNLVGMTLGAMYDSSSWEGFAQALADLEGQASSAALGRAFQQFWHPTNVYITKRGFPHYYNFLESFPAVACADADDPHSYAAWSAAGAASDAAYGTFGRIWTWASSICAAWPNSDSDRYVGPWNRMTANPVLVIGNLFDPATRYQGAVTASNLLPNSRLLTVHGWGHTSLFLSQCADGVQTRYLVDLTLPPVGTVCEQDHVPFTP
jgi:pimeloyl-ACP methyl ester carboxylesterase